MAFHVQPRDPRLVEWLRDYPPEVFDDRLYESIEVMERYSIELSLKLLIELGAFDYLDGWRSPGELCQRLRLQPQFASALTWLLERVVETGCVLVENDAKPRRYRLGKPLPVPELEPLRQIALQIDSGNAATLDLLDHAGSCYPGVARGEQTGEESLFGPRGVALWLNYFSNQNLTYAVNNWVGAILAGQRLVHTPHLRILEIGAGAGSASQSLLRWLDRSGTLPRLTRYRITEPNAFFRRRAQRELAAEFPNAPLEWATLDLDRPWKDQLAPGDEFDLVYAVNVLHVAHDLLFSLSQAASVLAPGGWVVIGECVRPYPNQPIYPELMFQTLASFIDVQTEPDIRPRPGFLTPEQWRAAFTVAGLHNAEVVPDIEKIREVYPHFFTGAICGRKIAAGHDGAGIPG